MTRPITIAIDGTFASGKGTLARRLAAHYGLEHLDTGKLYRATARDCLARGIGLEDGARAAAVAAAIDAATLDDPDLVGVGIGQAASKVSVHPAVRAALLDYQRAVAARGAVLDGRDIGTVVCPNATAKLFVDAEAAVRAARRFRELAARGDDVTLEGVLSNLRERDHRDMNRAVAPLRPAADAHLLDTTHLSIDAAVSKAVSVIDAVLAAKG